MLVKFKTLSARMKWPQYRTVGVLQSLWLFALHNARDGNLSTFSAADIAAWMEYDGDAEELIEALIATRWLDRGESGSLTIHDWEEHRPNWLKGVSSRGAGSKPGRKPSSRPGSQLGHEPSNGLGSEPTPLLQNQTQHNKTKPSSSQVDEDWAEAEAVLFRFGMHKASEAIAAVRASGCNPTQVANMIEFWRGHQPAWGVGLLYERLIAFRPEQSFDDLWPSSAEAPKQLSVEVFARHVRNGDFDNFGPKRKAENKLWAFGTLRSGVRVECRDYPLTKPQLSICKEEP